jgi:thioredoxin 2
MNRETVIVRCERCGTKNRIPKDRIGERAVCGKCRNPLSTRVLYPEQAVDVDDRNFAREVLNFPGSTVVFFWSPSCGYCQRLMPVFDQLSKEYAGRIKFAKLVSGLNPLTSSRYNIQSVPTLIYYKNGKEVDHTVGALPKEEIARHLSGIM